MVLDMCMMDDCMLGTWFALGHGIALGDGTTLGVGLHWGKGLHGMVVLHLEWVLLTWNTGLHHGRD